MEKVIKLPNVNDIQEQASAWVAKLDAGNMSDADSEALMRWLEESNSHGAALLEMADLLDDMTVLSQLSELVPLTELSVERKALATRPSISTPLKILAYACVFAVIGFFGFHYSGIQKSEPVLIADTNIGEFKTVTLPDGSTVTLNTNSRINIEFDQRERKVILTKGEAHFDVVTNKTRPFLVLAGDKVVTAIGTAFNVRTQGKDIEVTVTEGIVEIASIASPSAVNKQSLNKSSHIKQTESTRVSAGQVAIVAGKTGSLQAIDPASVEKKLAWRNGMIVFEGERLEEVVEEIGRYTTATFIITDEEARDIRVGGYFEVGDIEKMLDVLKHGFNISARTGASGTIYLSYLEQKDGQN